MTRLLAPDAQPANLLIRGAHVLDPRAGVDAPYDVLVRDGVIAELGAPGSLEGPAGAEVVEGEGRHAFPAFVDPHVHLRAPGQEHKEDLQTGTRAAAAGGYPQSSRCPTPTRSSTRRRSCSRSSSPPRREAHVPVGFMASVTRGLRGEELTDMVELRDVGALGFTDDGKPVVRAGCCAERFPTSDSAAGSSRCTRRTRRCPARV